MQLTDLIATPEQARRLNELEFENNCLYYYPYDLESGQIGPTPVPEKVSTDSEKCHPAPTLQEVIEVFNQNDKFRIQINNALPPVNAVELMKDKFQFEEIFNENNNLCHNAVDALIWALEQGFIKKEDLC